MSLYAQFDDDGPQMQIASNTGWSDFGAWIESLDVGAFPELISLWEYGQSNNIMQLGKEIANALAAHLLKGTVSSTAQVITAALAGNMTAEAVYVTSGMQPDDGEENDDEPAEPKSMKSFHFISTSNVPASQPAPVPANDLIGKSVYFVRDGEVLAGRVKCSLHGNAILQLAMPDSKGVLCCTSEEFEAPISELKLIDALAKDQTVKRFDVNIGVRVDKGWTAVTDDHKRIIDYLDVEFEGYASTFEKTTPRDRDGDYVIPGAFDATIAEFQKNPVMLTDHNNSVEDIAGRYVKIGVDSKGLTVRGRMSNSPHPCMVHKRCLVAEGNLRTLSIGGFFYYAADGRGIQEVLLFEISLVAIPANPDAIFQVRGVTVEDAKVFMKRWTGGVIKGGPGSGPRPHGGGEYEPTGHEESNHATEEAFNATTRAEKLSRNCDPEPDQLSAATRAANEAADYNREGKQTACADAHERAAKAHDACAKQHYKWAKEKADKPAMATKHTEAGKAHASAKVLNRGAAALHYDGKGGPGSGPHPGVTPGHFPQAILHHGMPYHQGSRTGTATDTGEPTMEYHAANGGSIFATSAGRVVEDNSHR